MNIRGIDKAEVLAALFNASHQQGMGMLNPNGREAMTKEQAQDELDRITLWCEERRFSTSEPYTYHFDYLNGRVMKVDITGDGLDPRLYDRDNGPGAARRALAHLLPKNETYTVTWTIDIEADSPEEAVHKAANMCFAQHIRDGEPDSATSFQVVPYGEKEGETIDIARGDV